MELYLSLVIWINNSVVLWEKKKKDILAKGGYLIQLSYLLVSLPTHPAGVGATFELQLICSTVHLPISDIGKNLHDIHWKKLESLIYLLAIGIP